MPTPPSAVVLPSSSPLCLSLSLFLFSTINNNTLSSLSLVVDSHGPSLYMQHRRPLPRPSPAIRRHRQPPLPLSANCSQLSHCLRFCASLSLSRSEGSSLLQPLSPSFVEQPLISLTCGRSVAARLPSLPRTTTATAAPPLTPLGRRPAADSATATEITSSVNDTAQSALRPLEDELIPSPQSSPPSSPRVRPRRRVGAPRRFQDYV